MTETPRPPTTRSAGAPRPPAGDAGEDAGKGNARRADHPAGAPAGPADVAPPGGAPSPAAPAIDAERLAVNAARLYEAAGRAAAAYLRPREEGRANAIAADELADAVRSIGKLAEDWMSDPGRALEAQGRLAAGFVGLWADALRRMQGEPSALPEPPRDKRFADEEWRTNPYFDFLRRAHHLVSGWGEGLVEGAQGLDPHARAKAGFHLRQLSAALSPSNFVATNPELIRATLSESGENLVRGMTMLAEDVAAGGGDLKLRQSDGAGFEVGRNLAATPGKVVYRNELFELLQYAPTTPDVLRRPLLICPPWINKYYVLDLTPEKSFVAWAVAQGLTVFVISWVNPDERHAGMDFEAYVRRGLYEALDAVEGATGERGVHALGYCVGGTLLSVALAHLAAAGVEGPASATLLTTQVDFTHAGDLKVFVDEEQIRSVEAVMDGLGYLPGTKMAQAFNMLRAQDLVWPYVVGTYLKGKQPPPFDLLHWNADATRMPRANHSFYLRECYLENRLAKGEMVIGGQRLDLSKVALPVYDLAAREDHIAPARSAYEGAKLFGGPVRYVLAGSGHIAGVVNPPAKGKYQHWVAPGDGLGVEGAFEDWLARATERPGSWWPDWFAWIEAQDPARVPAREPGRGLAVLGDAPGDYVRVKA